MTLLLQVLSKHRLGNDIGRLRNNLSDRFRVARYLKAVELQDTPAAANFYESLEAHNLVPAATPDHGERFHGGDPKAHSPSAASTGAGAAAAMQAAAAAAAVPGQGSPSFASATAGPGSARASKRSPAAATTGLQHVLARQSTAAAGTGIVPGSAQGLPYAVPADHRRDTNWQQQQQQKGQQPGTQQPLVAGTEPNEMQRRMVLASKKIAKQQQRQQRPAARIQQQLPGLSKPLPYGYPADSGFWGEAEQLVRQATRTAASASSPPKELQHPGSPSKKLRVSDAAAGGAGNSMGYIPSGECGASWLSPRTSKAIGHSASAGYAESLAAAALPFTVHAGLPMNTFGRGPSSLYNPAEVAAAVAATGSGSYSKNGMRQTSGTALRIPMLAAPATFTYAAAGTPKSSMPSYTAELLTGQAANTAEGGSLKLLLSGAVPAVPPAQAVAAPGVATARVRSVVAPAGELAMQGAAAAAGTAAAEAVEPAQDAALPAGKGAAAAAAGGVRVAAAQKEPPPAAAVAIPATDPVHSLAAEGEAPAAPAAGMPAVYSLPFKKRWQLLLHDPHTYFGSR